MKYPVIKELSRIASREEGNPGDSLQYSSLEVRGLWIDFEPK